MPVETPTRFDRFYNACSQIFLFIYMIRHILEDTSRIHRLRALWELRTSGQSEWHRDSPSIDALGASGETLEWPVQIIRILQTSIAVHSLVFLTTCCLAWHAFRTPVAALGLRILAPVCAIWGVVFEAWKMESFEYFTAVVVLTATIFALVTAVLTHEAHPRQRRE